MKNVAVTIPNLIQGVSQQPDPQRDPSQGEIQINGVSSIAEGLRKRDSSRTLAKVSSSGFGDAFFHTILRDSSEEYLSVITKDDIKVFELDGTPVDVRFDSGALDYLSTIASAKQEIRAVTVADYTWITNTNTPTATDPALAPVPGRPFPHECLVWVKQAVYGNEYKININGRESGVKTPLSAVQTIGSSIIEYRISSEEIADALRRGYEGGTVNSVSTSGNDGTYVGNTEVETVLNPAGATDLVVRISGAGSGVAVTGIVSSGGGWETGDVIKAFAKDINKTGVVKQLSSTFVGGSLQGTNTRIGARSIESPRSNLFVDITGNGSSITSVTVNGDPGYNWEVGDPIFVQRQWIEKPDVNVPPMITLTKTIQVTTTERFQIGEDSNGDPLYEDRTTVEDRTETYQEQDPNWDGPFDLSVDVQIAVVSDVGYSDNVEDPYELVEIGRVTSVSASSFPYQIERSGSVLWIKGNSPITIAAVDAKANATLTAILDSVQIFTELPTIAPVGYQINIAGDPGTNFDNYYIEFEPRSGSFGEGQWEETVSPGVEYKFNPSTMPHALIRTANDDFWFGAINGQNVSGIPGGVKRWGERIAGDYDTAPDPSFVGFPINDIFIYKNRLGFLSDENVVLSRVREFFEFFPETVTTVLDTDPIDVVASNNRVSVLKYAVPYQDELILFSAQIQYRFNAAETVLTPATAQITSLTQFDVDTNVRPQQAGGGIFFLQTNGQWSQMREFAVRGAGTALTADASDLTGYVSSYVPGECFKMTVNDTGNASFLISNRNTSPQMLGADYRKRIYVYKWFLRNTGNGAERAQNSWSYWEFGADEVLQIVCIREILYCLMRYGSDVYLEQISVLDREQAVIDAPYPMLLDRLVSTTAETPAAMQMSKGVYSEGTGKTTFTLPYTATNEVQVWSAYNMSQVNKAGPVLLGSTANSTKIEARGDWSKEEVWAGEKYEFRYRFSRFKLMTDVGGGKAVRNVVRTQVRQAKLGYHETGFFRVKTIPEGREPGVYVYDGTVLAVRNSSVGAPPASALTGDLQIKYQGVFNIPIMGRGDRVLVELLNDTPHPSKFSTCEWIGMVTSRSGAS